VGATISAAQWREVEHGWRAERRVPRRAVEFPDTL